VRSNTSRECAFFGEEFLAPPSIWIQSLTPSACVCARWAARAGGDGGGGGGLLVAQLRNNRRRLGQHSKWRVRSLLLQGDARVCEEVWESTVRCEICMWLPRLGSDRALLLSRSEKRGDTVGSHGHYDGDDDHDHHDHRDHS
jgi:hypothetical protein